MLNQTREAGAIEITPEMVVAGANEIIGRKDDDPDEVCEDVFAAMLAAGQIQLTTPRLSPSIVESHCLRRQLSSCSNVTPSGWVALLVPALCLGVGCHLPEVFMI